MQEVNHNVEEKGENLFSYLIFRFTPYWPLFLLLILISGAIGWAYLQKSTPMYEANATIMLKDEKKGVDDAKMLEALNIYTSKKIVENEIEVIRSRTLMTQVVEKLNLYAATYKEGKLRDENIYKHTPVTIIAKDPSSLKSSEKTYFTIASDRRHVTIGSQAYKFNEWQKTPLGELKFVLDTSMLYQADRPLYFVLNNPVTYAWNLVNGLTIKSSNKLSTVLNLNFVDQSTERASDILNELIANYERHTITDKNALASNTLSFIEDRLGLLVKEIDSIERTIQDYKSKEGIVDLSEQGKLFLNNVGDNDRNIGKINTQLAILNQVEKYTVSNDKKAGLMPSTLGLTDETLSNLLQKLYASELQFEQLKQTMGENSPGVAAVANEIATLRPAILENVRNQKLNLAASKDNISVTNGQYASIIKLIPQKERKLLEISREQSIKNGVYSYLLQKREETALSASSAVADSKLIDPAIVSWNPVSPKPLYVYLSAAFIALLAGIAIVIGKEFLTGKILFRSDIQKFTALPIAAEIASVSKKSEIIINSPDKASVSEQFRHLRASIGLYGRVVKKEKILVTSSIASEGKSFIAANLAVSLSLSGKKVVLVDADFRSPRTSSIFNQQDQKGFVEYLKNEVRLKDILTPTEFNNLSLVPAGGATNNPTELLMTGNLNRFFEELGEQFDFVIVDTSPVAPVTDAYVLADYCDKTLFVVRHGVTPKTMIQLLDENSNVKALSNLFIVFNGVKKRGFIKGRYGFGYGYGHEYVYKDRNKFRNKIQS